MTEALIIIPWILSALTIWVAFMAGEKNRHTWAVGIAAQAMWLVWIIGSGTWGMLPGNIAMWIIYTRNHLKWRAH